MTPSSTLNLRYSHNSLNHNLGFNWQIDDKHSLGARVESHDQFKTYNVAAFVAYNADLQKWGTVSAGLRYEHVGFDYIDNLDAKNNITRYQDEFFSNVTWA